MSELSELRRRREERMENGVKNLKGARLFPKTFSNHGLGDASFPDGKVDFSYISLYSFLCLNLRIDRKNMRKTALIIFFSLCLCVSFEKPL